MAVTVNGQYHKAADEGQAREIFNGYCELKKSVSQKTFFEFISFANEDKFFNLVNSIFQFSLETDFENSFTLAGLKIVGDQENDLTNLTDIQKRQLSTLTKIKKFVTESNGRVMDVMNDARIAKTIDDQDINALRLLGALQQKAQKN